MERPWVTEAEPLLPLPRKSHVSSSRGEMSQHFTTITTHTLMQQSNTIVAPSATNAPGPIHFHSAAPCLLWSPLDSCLGPPSAGSGSHLTPVSVSQF